MSSSFLQAMFLLDTAERIKWLFKLYICSYLKRAFKKWRKFGLVFVDLISLVSLFLQEFIACWRSLVWYVRSCIANELRLFDCNIWGAFPDWIPDGLRGQHFEYFNTYCHESSSMRCCFWGAYKLGSVCVWEPRCANCRVREFFHCFNWNMVFFSWFGF